MKSISLPEAIARMRELRHTEHTFVLEHLTYDKRRGTDGEIRHVQSCRLRAALPGEKFGQCADMFLPYTDVDRLKAGLEHNRVCRKRLIRRVAFPPDYELKTVIKFTS